MALPHPGQSTQAACGESLTRHRHGQVAPWIQGDAAQQRYVFLQEGKTLRDSRCRAAWTAAFLHCAARTMLAASAAVTRSWPALAASAVVAALHLLLKGGLFGELRLAKSFAGGGC